MRIAFGILIILIIAAGFRLIDYYSYDRIKKRELVSNAISNISSVSFDKFVNNFRDVDNKLGVDLDNFDKIFQKYDEKDLSQNIELSEFIPELNLSDDGADYRNIFRTCALQNGQRECVSGFFPHCAAEINKTATIFRIATDCNGFVFSDGKMISSEEFRRIPLLGTVVEVSSGNADQFIQRNPIREASFSSETARLVTRFENAKEYEVGDDGVFFEGDIFLAINENGKVSPSFNNNKNFTQKTVKVGFCNALLLQQKREGKPIRREIIKNCDGKITRLVRIFDENYAFLVGQFFEPR